MIKINKKKSKLKKDLFISKTIFYFDKLLVIKKEMKKKYFPNTSFVAHLQKKPPQRYDFLVKVFYKKC